MLKRMLPFLAIALMVGGLANAKDEAPWESLGVLAEEDFADADDFEVLEELGEVYLRNYERLEDGKVVLTSKKKLVVDKVEADGKRYLMLTAQEQLGKLADKKQTKEILEAKKKKKAVAFESKKALEAQDEKALQGQVYELYAPTDKTAPDRCYAEGTRVLFPQYPVRTWAQCVAWARGTGICRNVEMPSHYPPLSTDGCKCFY